MKWYFKLIGYVDLRHISIIELIGEIQTEGHINRLKTVYNTKNLGNCMCKIEWRFD